MTKRRCPLLQSQSGVGATGKRCINRHPTLVSACIPKEHVFAVFIDREEHEIVADYRRLRRVKIEPAPAQR
jgi:hypothetical protein